MKPEDFKSGDKVKIKSKSTGWSLEKYERELCDRSGMGIVSHVSTGGAVMINPLHFGVQVSGYPFMPKDLEIIDENELWHMQEVQHV